MSKSSETVTIIGAGLSGLACGYYLKQAGVPFAIVEASDGVGGRARTDVVDGFLLDRGFQVFLTAYPACQNVFNYDQLALKPFENGARIWTGKGFADLNDPWQNPLGALSSLVSSVGTPLDKWHVASLRNRVLAYPNSNDIFKHPERSSLQYLQEMGFSVPFIAQFFTPFLGGIFFDRDLKTSSRMLEFVFRMFASGEATLPQAGIGALANQLVETIGRKHIHLNTPVTALTDDGYRLENGQAVKTLKTVVATDWPSARTLLPQLKIPPSRSVTNVYFAAPEPPVKRPRLLLNGSPVGCVNNVSVVSQVQPSYAPAGQSLVSVTVLANSRCDDETLAANIKTELTGWFGTSVGGWRLLKTYRIRHALPQNFMPGANLGSRKLQYDRHVLLCGDYLENPSFNGAVVAGRRAANAIITELGQ